MGENFLRSCFYTHITETIPTGGTQMKEKQVTLCLPVSIQFIRICISFSQID